MPIWYYPHSRGTLTSVCVDIFTLSETVWQNNTYNALVLCVDRHSDWMIAQPSQHKGLTAEKCAHLLIDGGWSQFGVPSTITSDQALPRALQHIHDRVGECGLSPYKILMGRDRPLARIPYIPERDCPEDQDYFDHMEKIDKLMAANLNQGHQQTQYRHN